MAKWIVALASLLPLVVLLCSRWHEAARGTDDGAEAHAFLAAPLGPMVPVPSPEAVNDDLLAGIYVEVERALLRGGHLR